MEYDVMLWSETETWSGQRGIAGMKAMLNAKAGDGWRLVTALPHDTSTGGVMVILKRGR